MLTNSTPPIQKILFGPPGAGKSYRARDIRKTLEVDDYCTIEATFHPAYDYGDFVAKLLPMTIRRAGASAIEYRVHVGHLLRAVAKALEVGPTRNVLLIIDEINRGECARIFGDMFQLLDREADGWSAYGVNLSDLGFSGLMKELGWQCEDSEGKLQWKNGDDVWQASKQEGDTTLPQNVREWSSDSKLSSLFSKEPKLHFPPNLSIIGTMNTSDESVYYMDTAFKRRWSFEFIKWNYGSCESEVGASSKLKAQQDALLEGTRYTWISFLTKLNEWIREAAIQRRIDDKQVGLWFLRYVDKCNCTSWVGALPESENLDEWNNYLNKKKIDKFGASKSHPDSATVIPAIKKHLCSRHQEDLRKECNTDEYINNCNRIHSKHLGIGANTKKWINSVICNDYPDNIMKNEIENKLMHFVWDNVCSRDREPLQGLLRINQLRTFDEFVVLYEKFVEAVMARPNAPLDTETVSS